MWRLVPMLALSALAIAGMQPAVAQKGGGAKGKILAATAHQLVDYVSACMDEARPGPAPSVPSWLGERHAAAPARKPRVVIVSDARDTTLTPPHRQFAFNQLLDRLSGYDEINRVNFTDLGWALDKAMDVLGQKQSRDIAKAFDNSKTDFLVRLDGRYVAGGRRILARAIVWRIGTDCNRQTEEEAIEINAFDQSHLSPAEIMTEAATKLFAAHKGIRRVVVLRTLQGVSPIDAKAAAPIEAELKRAIEAAGGPGGGKQQDADLKSGGDDAKALEKVAVYRIGAGEYPPAAAGSAKHPGDWLARITVSTQGEEPALGVEFMPAIGRQKVKLAPATVSSHHVSVKAVRPAAELIADPTVEVGPQSIMRFAVQAHRSSAVYCAFQDLDGDAHIYYPTSKRGRAEVIEAGAALSFPGIPGGGVEEIRLETPGRSLLRCLAFPGGLQADLDRRWRSQYYATRAERGQPEHLSGTEFARLLEEMSAGREAYETETLLHILPPRDQP